MNETTIFRAGKHLTFIFQLQVICVLTKKQTNKKKPTKKNQPTNQKKTEEGVGLGMSPLPAVLQMCSSAAAGAALCPGAVHPWPQLGRLPGSFNLAAIDPEKAFCFSSREADKANVPGILLGSKEERAA